MIAPWCEANWQTILHRIDVGRLPHALLFSGVAGVGKRQFASCVAARLLCDDPGEYACGHCDSCRWLKLEHHPDFYFIAPLEDKKNISIAQVRELQTKLANTPQHSQYQVVVIQPAEAMNVAASNALLKTLEEPAGKVVLLLVTDHENRLLPTIASRCQRIKISVPDAELAAKWLSQHGVPDADALLAFCGNIPGTALQWAEKSDLRLQLLNEIQAVCDGVTLPSKIAESWQKDYLHDGLTVLNSVVQDLIRLQCGVNESYWQNIDQPGMLYALAEKYPLSWLIEYQNRLREVQRAIQSQANPNVVMVLEQCLIPLGEPSAIS